MCVVFRVRTLLHEGSSRREPREERCTLVGDVLAALLLLSRATRFRLSRRNNNAGDAMEESDDDESMDGAGYAGPEVFGPGRRLDSTETRLMLETQTRTEGVDGGVDGVRRRRRDAIRDVDDRGTATAAS